MSELLPCPFCGGEAVTVHDEWTVLIEGKEDYRHDWYVGCDPRSMLGCMGSLHNMETGFDTEEQAIAAWNTRVDYDAQRENDRRVELREAERDKQKGRGTCNIAHLRAFSPSAVAEHPNLYSYCPHCGAKVVEE